jgi:hypothetical protein
VSLGGHLDQPDQILRRGGLDQEPGRAGPQRAQHVLVGVEGGQHHHGRRVGQLADPLNCGDPVHPGHPQVHQHHVGPGAHHRLDPRRPVVRLVHHLDGGRRAEDRAQVRAHHGLIVHHHDPHDGSPLAGGRPAHSTGSAVGT